MSTQSSAGGVMGKTIPPSVRGARLNVSPSKTVRPLLSDIMVEHGPIDLLGRLFLKADTSARKRGVTLSFAQFIVTSFIARRAACPRAV